MVSIAIIQINNDLEIITESNENEDEEDNEDCIRSRVKEDIFHRFQDIPLKKVAQ